MAAGHGWGGASHAGSNHPALECASATPPCPRRGILSPTCVAVFSYRFRRRASAALGQVEISTGCSFRKSFATRLKRWLSTASD